MTLNIYTTPTLGCLNGVYHLDFLFQVLTYLGPVSPTFFLLVPLGFGTDCLRRSRIASLRDGYSSPLQTFQAYVDALRQWEMNIRETSFCIAAQRHKYRQELDWSVNEISCGWKQKGKNWSHRTSLLLFHSYNFTNFLWKAVNILNCYWGVDRAPSNISRMLKAETSLSALSGLFFF